MMSFLADACAGTQKQKITDRVSAYAWLEARRAQINDAQLVADADLETMSNYDTAHHFPGSVGRSRGSP
jgi:hypothetical protein